MKHNKLHYTTKFSWDENQTQSNLVSLHSQVLMRWKSNTIKPCVVTQPSSHEMKIKHNQTLCRYTAKFSWDENQTQSNLVSLHSQVLMRWKSNTIKPCVVTQPSSHEMKIKHNQTLCRYTVMFSWDENVLMFCLIDVKIFLATVGCQDFSCYIKIMLKSMINLNPVNHKTCFQLWSTSCLSDVCVIFDIKIYICSRLN